MSGYVFAGKILLQDSSVPNKLSLFPPTFPVTATNYFHGGYAFLKQKTVAKHMTNTWLYAFKNVAELFGVLC